MRALKLEPDDSMTLAIANAVEAEDKRRQEQLKDCMSLAMPIAEAVAVRYPGISEGTKRAYCSDGSITWIVQVIFDLDTLKLTPALMIRNTREGDGVATFHDLALSIPPHQIKHGEHKFSTCRLPTLDEYRDMLKMLSVKYPIL